MADYDAEKEAEPPSRGSRPSLVEGFTIAGLYGYRTISLSSPYAATILIAQNGSGKTTLLGALDAFLKGQFSRLRDFDFSEIRCKLQGINEELVLRHADIIDFLDIGADTEVARQARRIEVEPFALFKFVTEDYPRIKDDYRS